MEMEGRIRPNGLEEYTKNHEIARTFFLQFG